MNHDRRNIVTAAVFLTLFLLFSFSKSLVNLYTDWLWFGRVGYAAVFTNIIYTQVIIGLVVGLAYFVFLYANLLIAKRMGPTFPYWYGSQDSVMFHVMRFIKSNTFLRFFNLILVGVAFVFALGAGLLASSYWEEVLKYLNQVPFGVKDPVFNKDIAFHLFSIPFYNSLLSIGFQAVILAIALTAFIHFINGGIGFRNSVQFAPHTKAHLSVLLGFFFVLLGFSFKLNSFNLLLSAQGVIYGAGYTDIHANLPALNILFYASLIAAALTLVNIHFKGWKLPAIAVTFIVAVGILAAGVYPAVMQTYVVSPNEIVKETPYIRHAIDMTNRAYGLTNIQEKQFAAEQGLDQAALSRNKETIDNVRLWDWDPLVKTYNQIQSIRLYYDFVDVDVDRYRIDGETRQVAISPRELNINKLPDNAKTWQNQHLVYTHGYGIVANRVNEFSEEGLPRLIAKDIPPKSEDASLKVTRPEIYFGEMTGTYVVVGTKTREFDYPLGNANKYTRYEGKDGVNLDSILTKAAFAWRFGSLKLFLSDSLTADSRILFNRNITERASRIAPFLSYESDPYIVVDNGRLYWMIDAYTTGSRYPYSQPFEGTTNYIRNSVKVVVDAYDGTINYYVFDKTDPIVRSYQKAFPTLFKDASEMPAGLTAHIRYPESLFAVQSQMYAAFHMNDPQVFYNKEDLWTISKESAGDDQQAIAPYYMQMRLPGESTSKFLMLNTFSPSNKDNMIAWLAVNCDPDDYGRMLVYLFPKQKLVYGPKQIGARISQTPDISRELSLWNQQGSRVIRGNIFVVPVEDSLLYIQPLYLNAEQTELPELKRVIVAFGSKVVMEADLGSALNSIFGESAAPRPAGGPAAQPDSTGPDSTLQELIDRANQLFEGAQQKQRSGDWSGYGEDLRQLEQTLQELQESSGAQRQ